ncbi:MAG: winged helix-turn-helix domain-containing protein [Bryobacteraceae bacterium]|nr:winged helix-turn-helix domain-containing protein [Bryobacteraceae bacterium]
MNHNEVYAAFEILLEEIEAAANGLNEAGAEAFRAGDYEKAKAAIEEATRLAEFREKVKVLQKEWAGLLPSRPRVRKPKGRKTKARLPRGLRTPEDAFRRPILEALVELGGSAWIGDVLDRVEEKMKGVLNKYDYQPLPSDPRSKRWRNTAQWCRNTLVREGLVKGDSSYGVWEISDQGRKWLKEHKEKK